MSISAFDDRARQPTMEEILAALGSKQPLWEGITRFVAEGYQAGQEYKFYGKNYGWMISFRKGGKALAGMYPRRDGLVVQLILGEKQTQQALDLPLPEHFRKAIQEAHPYPEGRWVFLEVTSPGDAQQIEQLLLIKAPLPRGRARARLEGGG